VLTTRVRPNRPPRVSLDRGHARLWAAGWYSDWLHDEHNTIGPQKWETYTCRVAAVVEETFATRTDARGTIAG